MTDTTTPAERAALEQRERQRRLACIPRALVRSAVRYDELRKLSDEELKVWMAEHPADASRISAAARKRDRRAEEKREHLTLATPEEASHAAG